MRNHWILSNARQNLYGIGWNPDWFGHISRNYGTFGPFSHN